MQNQEHREDYLKYAGELLHNYVGNSENVYGKKFLVYNIHSLFCILKMM